MASASASRWWPGGTPDVMASAPGERFGGHRRAAEDLRRVLQWYGEQLVEDEREPFDGRDGLKHDQHREPNRVIATFGIGLVAPQRCNELCALLPGPMAVGAAGAQDVEALTGDNGREPIREVRGVGRGGHVDPLPGLLDGVTGLVDRAEHPVGNCAQPGLA